MKPNADYAQLLSWIITKADLTQMVLRFLPPEEILALSSVSRDFNEVSYRRALYPKNCILCLGWEPDDEEDEIEDGTSYATVSWNPYYENFRDWSEIPRNTRRFNFMRELVTGLHLRDFRSNKETPLKIFDEIRKWDLPNLRKLDGVDSLRLHQLLPQSMVDNVTLLGHDCHYHISHVELAPIVQPYPNAQVLFVYQRWYDFLSLNLNPDWSQFPRLKTIVLLACFRRPTTSVFSPFHTLPKCLTKLILIFDLRNPLRCPTSVAFPNDIGHIQEIEIRSQEAVDLTLIEVNLNRDYPHLTVTRKQGLILNGWHECNLSRGDLLFQTYFPEIEDVY